MITFREFAQGLGIICNGETHDRLLFMYRMHVPPAICDDTTDNSDAESIDSCVELKESGSSEDLSHDQPPQSQCVAEERPISVLVTRASEESNRHNSENNEDKKVTEIPPMSQV